MIREHFINNAENLVIDGYNMKCLFILHVLGKCIITQNQANALFFAPARYHSYLPHFKPSKLTIHFSCAEDL